MGTMEIPLQAFNSCGKKMGQKNVQCSNAQMFRLFCPVQYPRCADDVQESDGQRQESGRERQDRGHGPAVQEPHGRQAGREECAERRHGHQQGGGEESVAETVRGAGRGPRHHQAVLPCGRQWAEEDVPGEVAGAAELALCAQPVHADDGHADQDVHTESGA